MNTCLMCLIRMTDEEICESCNEVIDAGMRAIDFKRRSELGQDLDGDTIDLENIKKGEILI